MVHVEAIAQLIDTRRDLEISRLAGLDACPGDRCARLVELDAFLAPREAKTVVSQGWGTLRRVEETNPSAKEKMMRHRAQRKVRRRTSLEDIGHRHVEQRRGTIQSERRVRVAGEEVGDRGTGGGRETRVTEKNASIN